MNWPITSRLVPLLLVLSAELSLHAEETWLETQGGTTYRVTRRVEKQPVADTIVEPRTQTVYKTEFVTEMRETTQPVLVPVTHYITRARWRQWWNPFVQPYVAYETRPVTSWEVRPMTVQQPVTFTRHYPEQRVVQSATRSLGFVEQPVEERVVVAPPSRTAPAVGDSRYANQSPGVGDLPRQGQPATSLQKR